MAVTDALVQLLTDDDLQTVQLVKEQLEVGDALSMDLLQTLTTHDNAIASAHAKEILARIASRQAEEDFVKRLSHLETLGDLENAMWVLSQNLSSEGDQTSCLRKIDSWGRELRLRISGAISSRERVHRLAEFLFGECAFRGNTECYYNIRNSLLAPVIHTRLGIPITLCFVYIIVAKRAGMEVEGINLPGHFIVRHEDTFFDPFHRGKILTRSNCEEILARQNLKLQPCHLIAATPKQIMTRVLANLLYVYDIEQNVERCKCVRQWIQHIAG